MKMKKGKAMKKQIRHPQSNWAWTEFASASAIRNPQSAIRN
ncbi:MAG: hypothetical protein AB1757_23760 [Acidobacteriota bacterium]